MPTRKIVKIDPEKCDGCGLCVPDCAEGAIKIIDGKARLVADNLCDGLGNCLGACPKDAITIEERSADAFDEAAVKAHLAPAAPVACGCPGAAPRKLDRPAAADAPSGSRVSRLGQWPVQLALVPASGDLWRDADVLIAADCVPAVMPDFHERLLDGKTVAIACPKLDDVSAQVDKLAAIFANNAIRSVTVAHLEVPCCGGILTAVRRALEMAGRTDVPTHDVTVGVDGTIKEEGRP